MKQAGIVLLVLLVGACSSGSRTSSTKTDGGSSSSSSSDNCGSYDEGDYRCRGGTGSDSIEKCVGGEWVYAKGCTCSVSVGDPRKPPYASTCKYNGTGAAECSYAGVRCLECQPGMSCASK